MAYKINSSELSLQNLDYFSLIGKNITDPDIQYILNSNKSFKTKEISNHLYINFLEEGISLNFLDKRLTTIFFFNEGVHGYKQFKGMLPYKITWEMKNKAIVEKLGDTKIKGGGNVPVWLAFNNLGIEFSFLGKLWADTENVMTHISLFQKEKSNDCSVCLKEVKTKHICNNKCGLVLYCSEQCKNIHMKFHINYC